MDGKIYTSIDTSIDRLTPVPGPNKAVRNQRTKHEAGLFGHCGIDHEANADAQGQSKGR